MKKNSNLTPKSDFNHVSTWVFDLDNTLYPPSDRLFDQIEVRMTEYVMTALNVGKDKADHLRQHYWEKYGTTLAGLMDEHDLDPAPYLTHVHDISLSHMSTAPKLSQAIAALPGRKIVYTNGTAPYAERVLEARGLHRNFDAIYGVEHANFRPKPERRAFETIFSLDQVAPASAAMFEDDARNLHAPHQMGMRTVHVAPQFIPHDHIQYHTSDLTAFLSQLV